MCLYSFLCLNASSLKLFACWGHQRHSISYSQVLSLYYPILLRTTLRSAIIPKRISFPLRDPRTVVRVRNLHRLLCDHNSNATRTMTLAVHSHEPHPDCHSVFFSVPMTRCACVWVGVYKSVARINKKKFPYAYVKK